MSALQWKSAGAIALVVIASGAVSAYKSTVTYQGGFSGTAMQIVDTKEHLAKKLKDNEVPPSLPPASHDGKLAIDAYQNVKVLGHLSSGEVTRLMAEMTIWVSPDAGCGYCHAPQRDGAGNVLKNDQGYALADPNNMQSDELYTKRVARRMLQMTMHINSDWTQHVQTTGVTCYTCHRGNPVPAYIWFDQPEAAVDSSMMGNTAGQNRPSALAGLSSLPGAALRPFLAGDENIRVQATTALGSDDRSSIKQTEWTYALMMHMSTSLGVNCTYCHNTRSMGEWSTSPATRSTAWFGIRMVRELNQHFLEPLHDSFPPSRLGELGDSPKLSCVTCHQGAYKPLLGVSMLKDNPELAEAKPQPEKTPVPPPEVPAPAASAVEPSPAPSAAPSASSSAGPASSVKDSAAVSPPKAPPAASGSAPAPSHS